MSHPRPWVLLLATLLLFAIWSNSFNAVAYLLGNDGARAQLDWRSLTVARVIPAAALCALYCFALRREESLSMLRSHWPRLLLCGFVVGPAYNLALYYSQQHGLPAPVASLVTTLVPLFVMLLAAIFLGEKLTARRVSGFAVAALGMLVISQARRGGEDAGYSWLILVAALAPLCWSVYSVVSKPMTGRVSPVVWTYLATTLGGLMLLPWLPGSTWRQWSNLDGAGWAALLYLSIPCTVLGFAVWTWLLRHLPATSVGFTVFLNPPLTTTSKFVLALLFPATVLFSIRPLEWIGGVLTLAGLAIAVYVPRRSTRASAA